MRLQHLILILIIYTMFSCMKKIIKSCRCVLLLGCTLNSNSFNFLALILHRDWKICSFMHIINCGPVFGPKIHMK